MSKLYFIDHESIKKTAKAIKKQNEKHNYTYILDELTKCLGYTSYNNYEHYLTNAFMHSKSKLENLISLAQLTIPNLIALNDLILEKLLELNITTNSLYFIDKLISNKVDSFKNHKHLSLSPYLYYLPFIFGINEKIIYLELNEREQGRKNFIDLINTMKKYYFNSPFISFKDNKYFLNASKQELKKAAKEDLKNRCLYYLSLSNEEGIIYEESILIKLLLNNDSDDSVFDEMQYVIKCFGIDYGMRNTPNFSSNNNALDYNILFPYIKNNINNEQPLILGVDDNNKLIFFNKEDLFRNTFMCGLIGSGLHVPKQSITLQALMNNRGFLNIDAQPRYTVKKSYEERRIDYISSLFNKQDETFFYNTDDVNLLSRAINHNKIINFNLLDWASQYKDLHSESATKLLIVLKSICNSYYDARFRKNSFPYYIFIDHFDKSELNESIFRVIKDLNSVGIYTIFVSCFESSLNRYHETFENLIIPNSDIRTLVDLDINITGGPPSDKRIGANGPSNNGNGVGLSHYSKMKFKQQFFTKHTSNYRDFETGIRDLE